MNKTNITLPIIKINVNYSIRSKEKSGLFEYTILDIYQNFNNSEFQNYTFRDFIHEILQAKVPDLFIEKALEYLDYNKILISEYEDGLIDLPISTFKVSNQKTLKTMLENKELYSQPQAKNMDLYYDPLINQIINVNSDQLIKDIDKPIVSGNKFMHMNITDSTKSTFIEFIKKQESSFYKDGAKVDDIKEQYVSLESENKRETLYRSVEIPFKINHRHDKDYELILDKKYEFLSRYKVQFINTIFENTNLSLEKSNKENKFINHYKTNTTGIILSDTEDICDVVNGNVFIIYSNENSQPIKISDTKLKFKIDQNYPWKKNSYIVDGNLHYWENVNISDVKKDIKVIELNNLIQEAYERISKALIDKIFEISFSKINHSDFYENIQYLTYLQFNSDDIRTLLLEKIEDIDIKSLAIRKVTSLLKYTKNILTENDHLFLVNKYLDSNDENIDSLIEMLTDENIKIDKSDLEINIQNYANDHLIEKSKYEIKYVLDTNILISIGVEAFEKKNLILSAAVVEELDDVKKNQPDTLQTIKKIQKYLNKSDREDIIYENSNELIDLLPAEYRKNKRDNMILALCLQDKENRVLVTNDQNLQLKAKVINIKSINSGIFLKEK